VDWPENLDIAGPWSIGPVRVERPLRAQTPAGPNSLPWPVEYFRSNQPQLGLVWPWEGDPYLPGGGPPTYGVETYAPYCGDVWKWVLGTAVVMFVLLGNKQRS